MQKDTKNSLFYQIIPKKYFLDKGYKKGINSIIALDRSFETCKKNNPNNNNKKKQRKKDLRDHVIWAMKKIFESNHDNPPPDLTTIHRDETDVPYILIPLNGQENNHQKGFHHEQIQYIHKYSYKIIYLAFPELCPQDYKKEVAVNFDAYLRIYQFSSPGTLCDVTIHFKPEKSKYAFSFRFYLKFKRPEEQTKYMKEDGGGEQLFTLVDQFINGSNIMTKSCNKVFIVCEYKVVSQDGKIIQKKRKDLSEIATLRLALKIMEGNLSDIDKNRKAKKKEEYKKTCASTSKLQPKNSTVTTKKSEDSHQHHILNSLTNNNTKPEKSKTKKPRSKKTNNNRAKKKKQANKTNNKHRHKQAFQKGSIFSIYFMLCLILSVVLIKYNPLSSKNSPHKKTLSKCYELDEDLKSISLNCIIQFNLKHQKELSISDKNPLCMFPELKPRKAIDFASTCENTSFQGVTACFHDLYHDDKYTAKTLLELKEWFKPQYEMDPSMGKHFQRYKCHINLNATDDEDPDAYKSLHDEFTKRFI